MSQLTIKQMQETAKSVAIIEELTRQYFKTRYPLDPEWRSFIYQPSIENIDIDEDGVDIEAEAPGCTRGWCGTEYRTYSVSFEELLMTPEAIRIQLAAEKRAQDEADRKEKEAAARKRKADKIKRDKEKVIKERERLKELAAKYPEEVLS